MDKTLIAIVVRSTITARRMITKTVKTQLMTANMEFVCSVTFQTTSVVNTTTSRTFLEINANAFEVVCFVTSLIFKYLVASWIAGAECGVSIRSARKSSSDPCTLCTLLYAKYCVINWSGVSFATFKTIVWSSK